MDNHYHLLVETQSNNLPTLMRIVNANYAQFFNRKYKRTGHLWQDRYQSRYITSDPYLYTLIRYIEYNPIEAGLSTRVGEYPFTLAYSIFQAAYHYPCCNDSLLLKKYDVQTLGEFLEVEMSEGELIYLMEEQRRKIEEKEESIVIARSKTLEEHFNSTETKKERNNAIATAYRDGHTQSRIADYLGVSTSLISKLLKNNSLNSAS